MTIKPYHTIIANVHLDGPHRFVRDRGVPNSISILPEGRDYDSAVTIYCDTAENAAHLVGSLVPDEARAEVQNIVDVLGGIGGIAPSYVTRLVAALAACGVVLVDPVAQESEAVGA